MNVPVLLLLLLLSALFPGFAGRAHAGLDTKAAQVFLIEAETGTVLLAKNEDQPVSPASLVKLMTAEVVFAALKAGEISLDTDYPVSEYAWRTGGAPSRTATMFAALKSRVRAADLLRAMTVQQANDACIILAEGLTGSEAAFVTRMNAQAKEIGLSRSTFSNSTGLPDPGNRVTMRDMVTLARHLQQTYPDFYATYAEPEFEWNKIRQRNRNPLLSLNVGADGLASGFAEGEGYAIVASVAKDGKRLFLAMSGLSSDKERAEEAQRILAWGLSAFESRTLFSKGETVGAASVYGGTASSVDLVAIAAVSVFVPADDPERLTARIVYRWPLTAPVQSGVEAGQLKIYAGDKLLREVSLYTANPVERGSLPSRAMDAAWELMFSWL